MKNITIVHVGNANHYPPVLSLMECLIDKGYSFVIVCGTKKEDFPTKIQDYKNIRFVYIEENNGSSIIDKISRHTLYKKRYVDAVKEVMKYSEYLWTTTDLTIKILGDEVLKYTHIMQLMELFEKMPMIGKSSLFKVPMEKYAKHAHRVVVPQEDRAYIQQSFWGLDSTPIVLPNKPYNLDYGYISSSMKGKYDIMNKEKRKIILYLGAIGDDRNITDFAEAISEMNGYALYLIGNPMSGKEVFLDKLLEKYPNVVYLGSFKPPQHLYFVKKAHIGLLPYAPVKYRHYSVLNAQYCAPNKLFEYTGYGVPVIGTNVLGLKRPIESFKIGKIVEKIEKKEIIDAISTINKTYKTYSENCFKFYNSFDFSNIVDSILQE